MFVIDEGLFNPSNLARFEAEISCEYLRALKLDAEVADMSRR